MQILTNRRAVWLVSTLALLTPIALRVFWDKLITPLAVANESGPTAFTLHLREIISVDASGLRKVSSERIIARRSDGSITKWYVRAPGKETETRHRTVRLSNYQHIEALDSVGRKITSRPWSQEAISNYRRSRPTPVSDCTLTGSGKPWLLGYEKVGTEFVGGIRAIKFTKKGDPAMEVWHAPGFGCEEVRRVARFSGCCAGANLSPPVGPNASELVLVSAVAGEPDPRLFDISGLKETLPSKAIEMMLRKQGQKEQAITRALEELRKSDGSYLASRAEVGVYPEP
jgi:hypothetical protein